MESQIQELDKQLRNMREEHEPQIKKAFEIIKNLREKEDKLLKQLKHLKRQSDNYCCTCLDKYCALNENCKY